jgi:hypothetical protein
MTIPQATEALRGSVRPDTLLCTDGSGALRGAAKALGVTSKSIAVSYGGRVVEGVYHVQTVNSYHERLQSWLTRELRGVATKYLPNYLAWMRGFRVVQRGLEAGALCDFGAWSAANQYLTQAGARGTRHFFPGGRGTGPVGLALSAFDNAVAAAESRSIADLYAALSSRRSTDSTITMSLSSSTS